MIDYRNIIKNREFRLKLIGLLRFIPDKPYLKMVYRIKTGKKLNLEHPVGFNEKLQWLKLHDQHPEYTQLVDKYEVRDYIKKQIGEDYLFPLIGIWDSFDDIDFDKLPEQFVLKCTHDSGSVKIIKSKKEIDYKEFRRFFNEKLKRDPFVDGREYPYKDVKPRIIAEKFMCNHEGKAPNDYKFFCFNGKPEFLFVATDRETDVTHTVFDMDFNKLDIQYVHHQAIEPIEKPVLFEKMKQLGSELSQGMRFVRIDLYEIDEKIYFGEFTFFPAGGFYLFSPPEWEKRFGDLVILD